MPKWAKALFVVLRAISVAAFVITMVLLIGTVISWWQARGLAFAPPDTDPTFMSPADGAEFVAFMCLFYGVAAFLLGALFWFFGSELRDKEF